MKIRRMGQTGLKVSELCLGTMTFGNQADERTSFAILDRAATFREPAHQLRHAAEPDGVPVEGLGNGAAGDARLSGEPGELAVDLKGASTQRLAHGVQLADVFIELPAGFKELLQLLAGVAVRLLGLDRESVRLHSCLPYQENRENLRPSDLDLEYSSKGDIHPRRCSFEAS